MRVCGFSLLHLLRNTPWASWSSRFPYGWVSSLVWDALQQASPAFAQIRHFCFQPRYSSSTWHTEVQNRSCLLLNSPLVVAVQRHPPDCEPWQEVNPVQSSRPQQPLQLSPTDWAMGWKWCISLQKQHHAWLTASSCISFNQLIN